MDSIQSYVRLTPSVENKFAICNVFFGFEQSQKKFTISIFTFKEMTWTKNNLRTTAKWNLIIPSLSYKVKYLTDDKSIFSRFKKKFYLYWDSVFYYYFQRLSRIKEKGKHPNWGVWFMEYFSFISFHLLLCLTDRGCCSLILPQENSIFFW